MKLQDCYNHQQFRRLAKKRLPGPIFHYIDGAADDEVTYRRNTQAYDDCDLVPNVLAGVEDVDMSTTVMGKKIDMPLFLSPTALQRLFHHEGEFAVARAAEIYGTWFGISSLGTASIEDVGSAISTPKMFQLYYHKDRGLTNSMIDRCKDANFDAIALTVDTIVGGNRERDLITGFTSPPRLTPKSVLSFAAHPRWTMNFLFREKFELSQLKDYVDEGTNISLSVSDYFSTMLDQSMDWKAAEEIRKNWGKQFCLKGIMSVDDARRAAISVPRQSWCRITVAASSTARALAVRPACGNCRRSRGQGGRHLRRRNPARNACAQSTVGGCQGVLGWSPLSVRARGGGQAGVEKALSNLRTEIERGMKLMGARSVAELGRQNLRYR